MCEWRGIAESFRTSSPFSISSASLTAPSASHWRLSLCASPCAPRPRSAAALALGRGLLRSCTFATDWDPAAERRRRQVREANAFAARVGSATPAVHQFGCQVWQQQHDQPLQHAASRAGDERVNERRRSEDADEISEQPAVEGVRHVDLGHVEACDLPERKPGCQREDVDGVHRVHSVAASNEVGE